MQKHVIVPTFPDYLALQKFFFQKLNYPQFLPKIIICTQNNIELPTLYKTFEEKWIYRFQNTSSISQALNNAFAFLNQDECHQILREHIIHNLKKKNLTYETACFFDKNSFDLSLKDGEFLGSIHASNQMEEALNIAYIVRKHIEKQRVAIICQDSLSQLLITYELKKYNILPQLYHPIKSRYKIFYFLLKLGLEWDQVSALEIIDHFLKKDSSFLEINFFRKKPSNYESVKEYLLFNFEPYLNQAGKKKTFTQWCELYKDFVPDFFYKMPIKLCSFEEFSKISKTLLEKKEKIKGNTLKVQFYQPNEISYLSEDVVIFSGMSTNLDFQKERFIRACKSPFFYMTRYTADKHHFWKEKPLSLFSKKYKTYQKIKTQANPQQRPTKISITDCEKYIKDPYGLYIKHCLKLYPLGELNKEWSNVDFGIIFHTILEDVFKKNLSLQTLSIESYLNHIDSELIKTFWIERLNRLIPLILEKEPPLQVEEKVIRTINNLIINGRIDRIERDGKIIDYKTGVPPTKKDIETGYSVQLTISGIILNEKYIEYWHLGQKEIKVIPFELNLDQQKKYLLKVINAIHFKPFIPCPIKEKQPSFNPYAHLERI